MSYFFSLTKMRVFFANLNNRYKDNKLCGSNYRFKRMNILDLCVLPKAKPPDDGSALWSRGGSSALERIWGSYGLPLEHRHVRYASFPVGLADVL